MILTKLDQHVNEMMTMAGKKFQNFWWSCFLIIVQNVNMITNGNRNSRLNPYRRGEHDILPESIEQIRWRNSVSLMYILLKQMSPNLQNQKKKTHYYESPCKLQIPINILATIHIKTDAVNKCYGCLRLRFSHLSIQPTWLTQNNDSASKCRRNTHLCIYWLQQQS